MLTIPHINSPTHLSSLSLLSSLPLEPLMLTIRFDGTVNRETRSNLFVRFLNLIPVMDLPYVSTHNRTNELIHFFHLITNSFYSCFFLSDFFIFFIFFSVFFSFQFYSYFYLMRLIYIYFFLPFFNLVTRVGSEHDNKNKFHPSRPITRPNSTR